jgi:hypothetical protein
MRQRAAHRRRVRQSIWAERYDRDLADTFAVQDEITTAVVLAIGPVIVDAEQQRAGRKQTESLGAWDAYMRGLWHLDRGDPAEMDKARSLFERAIELDPNLSQSYQELVHSFWRRYSRSIHGTSPRHAQRWNRWHIEPLRSTRAM